MKKRAISKSDGKACVFVGMDLHKNYLLVAVMDEKGKVLKNSKVDNDLKKGTDFFDKISNPSKVVMESSCVWYNNIYQHLSEERHLDVILSNPIRTRAIASPKAPFDRYEADGYGSYNGVPGYQIHFEFTDAGKPGTKDTVFIVIHGGPRTRQFWSPTHSSSRETTRPTRRTARTSFFPFLPS